MRLLASETVYRLVRWSLAMVFIYAGVGKLSDTEAFATLIDSFG